METQQTPDRSELHRELAAELAAARTEINRLRAILYRHPGKNGRTLATAADIDNLLSETRKALTARLAQVGIIKNATLLLAYDL